MSSPHEKRDVFDVAVVGFGPSGAAAAALLGMAGLKTWVGDRSHDIYDKPRAIALDHEILRLFQQIGILDKVMPHVEPFTPSEYFGVDGKLIKRLTMIEPPFPLGHTPSNVFTQPPVEAELRQKVASLKSVEAELGVNVKGMAQTNDLVELDLDREDGSAGKVRARYVIGCDGASSRVRELAGIELEDLSFDEPWLVVDVLVNDAGLAKLPVTSVQYCEPERPCTLVIGPGRHRRWEISLKDGEDPTLAATPEHTWELLSRWLTPEDGTLWRQASYRFHALVAKTWRNGRVFIAGDAAHQQPPFLGQGMCQGLRDVANLSWKLASVLGGEVHGAAAEALLDSYGLERKGHVTELTTRIKGIGAVICERDPTKARERDEKLLGEANGVVRDVPRQDVLPRLETGFLSQAGMSAVGTIFPQPWILREGARVRLDDLTGHGWRLATKGPVAQQDLTGLTHIPLGEDHWNEADGVLERWMTRNQCIAALVRPDQYVFGIASSPAEMDALLHEWRSRLA